MELGSPWEVCGHIHPNTIPKALSPIFFIRKGKKEREKRRENKIKEKKKENKRVGNSTEKE
jgi:hypothetical protein